MIKYFKWFLKIMLGLTLLVFLGMAAIMFFVDPNDYKNTIESKVLAQTGHALRIKGPMTWKWSPTLMLQIDDVTLDNQKPFQNALFSAKNIRADLSLASLFTGKIIFNLQLKGVDLSLIRNKEGKANWETLLNAGSHKPENIPLAATEANLKNTQNQIENKVKEKELASSKSSSSLSVLLNSLQIEDGQVNFQDQGKNTHYQIKHLKVDLDNVMKGLAGISNSAFLSFQWTNLSSNASGNFELDTDWSLNLIKEQFTISDLTLRLEGPGEKSTVLNGKITIKNIHQNPNILAALESKNFELKAWLKDLGISQNPSLPQSADFKAEINFQAPYLSVNHFDIQFKDNGTLKSNLKLDITKLSPATLELQGDFKGEKLVFDKIKLDEMAGKINGKAGIIQISPLSILIAKSQQQANIQIDLRGPAPKYVVNTEAHNFEISLLLKLFGIENKIEGNTNLKINISAMGNSGEELRKSLSGQSQIEIKNGKFAGVDLITLLKTLNTNVYSAASALTKKPSLNLSASWQALQDIWKQKQTAVNPNASTPFASLKASFNIQNGLVHNPDLIISDPEYQINGNGKIDINRNSMDYHASAQLNKNPYPANDELGQYLYSSALPIHIFGPFANLTVLPDIKVYANNAFGFAQKSLVESTIYKEGSKVVNNVVGKVVNKDMGENVNKTIENTLNSIFEKVGH